MWDLPLDEIYGISKQIIFYFLFTAVIECPEPEAIDNTQTTVVLPPDLSGNFTGSYPYGTKVFQSCLEGYWPTDTAAELSCIESREWTGGQITCQCKLYMYVYACFFRVSNILESLICCSRI